ncbi:MAG: hypothetical protein CL868_10060 [Cytophagaceae bacterium]|nr:hypothetical protein [Cytophagaceae bacterium]|tara:strand:- start:1042 stop:1263 length:222 start_codon:yes stop_codon:yes gene_type:complete
MRRQILITVLFFLVGLSAKAQCAMCRAALQSDTDNSMAQGVNNGILYLMIIPYILVGIVIFYIYKTQRKADSQ